MDSNDKSDRKKRRLEASTSGADMKTFIVNSFRSHYYYHKPPSGTPWQNSSGDLDEDDIAVKLWRDLPEKWKNDPDVALEAWKSNCVKARDITCFDVEFFRNGVLDGKFNFWVDFRYDDLGHDPDFVASCSTAIVQSARGNADLRFLLNVIPNIARDRKFWLRLFSQPSVAPDFTFMLPQNVREDKEVMMKAFLYHEYIPLSHAGLALCQDRSFLEALLDHHPRRLLELSPAIQQMFPGLVMKTFEPFAHYWYENFSQDPSAGFALGGIIHPVLWADRRIVLAWFQAGLPYVSNFPITWTKDRTIYLLIAEHCQITFRAQSFQTASSSLLADKDFFAKVLEHDTSLFFHAPVALQKNFDLAVHFFAKSSKNVVIHYSTRNEFQPVFIRKLHRRIEKKLAAYESYSTSVLPGIYNPSCALSFLDQGAETSCIYVQLIADYLDVPTRNELRLLRRALPNILLLRHYF